MVVGDTDRLARPVTSPTALSIETLVAPDVVHDRLEDCPTMTLDGVAANPTMVGEDMLGIAVPL